MGKNEVGAVVTATVLNRRVEVGDGRWGGAMWQARAKGEGERGGGSPADRRMAPDRQWPETGGRRWCDIAMPHGRPNRGGGRGLIGGPRHWLIGGLG
jgi:hypothetical protein